ncbi:DDE-type integrase/transposase/recombinase [Kordiimonas marina]|uniref:DDE-type integrase/transposase/recombinase n=1 Tax=Kordiimonas marina TaxID=2872312 RepID=UPI001FF1B1CD|nr:DDE-type integrase/transposase/recombinase [Kordiimonas marina]MCJ9430023.1 DDE-type integrase/transposase/recombinase [Kordiimonas marina]
MPSVALLTNTPIEMDGDLYRIVGRVRAERIHLERFSDQEITQVSMTEIMDKVCKGKAVIRLPVRNGKAPSLRIQGKLKEEIQALSAKTRAIFEKKYTYVKGVLAYMPIPRTKERLTPIIAEVAVERGDKKCPSASSVCRWLKDYEDGCRDPRALIPSFKNRGNRERRLCGEVLEIVQRGIEEHFLNIQRGSPTAVMDYIVLKIDELNQVRSEPEQLEAPDKRTVYRAIEAVDAYTRCLKRYGKEATDRQFKGVQQALLATRALERVEIDHTVLDLFVIDEETGMIIGRPTLTIAVDCYSRWIVGFYVGFEPPGWQSVMHCLRHAIMPKDCLRERFPSVLNEWQCCGVPETLVVDNGREFHSADLELACEQLGIQIQYSPRGKPWFKGRVERLFGTIGTKLLTGARGKTLGRLLRKTEYDPQKDSIVGLEQFTEAFCKWVVDVYVREYHSGLCDTPSNVWLRGLEDHPGLRVPTSLDDFMVVMSSVRPRTIHRYGIELNGLKYQSEALGHLRQRLYKRGNPLVEVKFDPSNLGYIHVKDPGASEYLSVPAVELEYAHDTNLWQHSVVRRYMRRLKAKGEKGVCLARARIEIAKILNESRVLKLPVASSTRAARYRGAGSNNVLMIPQEARPTEADTEDLMPDGTDFAEDGDYENEEGEDGWGISTNDDYPE